MDFPGAFGAGVTLNTADGGDATANTVTLAAASGTQHIIDSIQWSFDDDPATGSNIIITVNAVEVFKIYIRTAGPGFIMFRSGDESSSLHGGDNEAIVVTQSSGGAGIAGTLNVQSR